MKLFLDYITFSKLLPGTATTRRRFIITVFRSFISKYTYLANGNCVQLLRNLHLQSEEKIVQIISDSYNNIIVFVKFQNIKNIIKFNRYLITS